VPGIGGAKYGSSRLLVAEADESDRSFLRYRPQIAVVTSIEPDHLENYNGSFAELKKSYAQHLDNLKPGGWAVVCADDASVREVVQGLDGPRRRFVWYGLEAGAFFRGVEIKTQGFRTSFRVLRGAEPFGEYLLGVPGRHNVQNALACIAVCDCLGIERGKVAAELTTFRGAKRRFEVISEENGILIIDDYAHHPTEIRATLQAAKNGWNRRIIAVFQPHRYSRTSQLMNEFARSFDAADRLILTEVYAPPPEKPIPGVSGKRLAELARERLGDRVEYVPRLEDVVDRLCALAQEGDIVVTMGAGDVWRAAHAFAQRRRR